MMKNGRETGGITKIPPVPQRVCTKGFRAKTGGREGFFEKFFFSRKVDTRDG